MKIAYFALAGIVLMLPHTTKANDEIKRLAALQAQVQSADWSILTQLVTASPEWPKVPSSFEASKMNGESKVVAELKINLADALRLRILGQCKAFIGGEKSMDTQTLKDLAAISKRLQLVGGYGNYVVANYCSELIFYDLSGKLVRNEAADAIKELTAKLTPAKADWKESLKTLAQADPFLATPDKVPLVEEAVKKQSLIEAFMALGLGLADAGTLYGRRASSYSNMLKGDYVLDLIYSTAITEKSFLVGLSATIEYLKSGGSFDDIKDFNDKMFYVIFKNFNTEYAYPSLGIRFLSPDDIGYLISIHNDPGIKEAFQARLLN
jgi:hypothetical protein